MARGAISGRGWQVWLGRCPHGLEPRWRGHGHLSLVTGPDSRVASYVGGRVQISLEIACGHHASTLSPTAGRALSDARSRASIWPISQAKAPLCGGLAGRQLAKQARGSLLPTQLERSGVKAGLPLSAWLGCGSLGLPAAPYPQGSLLQEDARDSESPRLGVCDG